MKRKKVYQVIGAIIIVILLLSACAKKDDFETASTSTEDKSTSGLYDAAAPQAAADGSAAVQSNAFTMGSSSQTTLTSTSALSADVSAVQTQDKIIRRFFLEVETQEFDSLITKVDAKIKTLGGYVESSKISGKRYYDNADARYGSIVARIPSDKVDEFVNQIDADANIVDKEESSENVSLQYIDAQSRVETLKIEQERLYAILEKEVSLENIITLESRLSDIRYELQNNESQIRYYDNQVSFSTVNLNVQEVDKLTPVTVEKQTVGTRIKNGFGDTMYKLGEGFKDFFVWFVVNLPYLLIWALIIGITALIIRRTLKKNKRKTVTPAPAPMTLFGPQNQGQQEQKPSGYGPSGTNASGQGNQSDNQPPQNQA